MGGRHEPGRVPHPHKATRAGSNDRMTGTLWSIEDEGARAVGSHVKSILPSDVGTSSNLYFEQAGELADRLLPEEGEQATVHVAGGIGAHAEFKVSVIKQIALKYVTEAGDPVERKVHLTFYRAESKHLERLDPFEYVVQIRVVEGGSTRTDMRRVTIADVASDRFLGKEETVAALVLAEIVAERKSATGPERDGGKPQASSFAQGGSIEAAADGNGLHLGFLTPDWETMTELLGPEAETVVAAPIVRTTIPEPDQLGGPNAIDFLASDGILQPESDRERASSLEDSLEELLAATITDVFESEDQIISRTRSELLEAQARYDSTVDSFPAAFIENLSNENFGAAKSLVATDANYDRLVLEYSFQQLYGGVTALLAGQDSIEDLSLAVTAFANGLAAGDVEMAQRGLDRASEAYVDVTRHLLENGKDTIESLRPVLSFHDLVEPFNRRLAAQPELAGEELAYYESAVGQLVEAAREQHERAEKAREVFHRYME